MRKKLLKGKRGMLKDKRGQVGAAVIGLVLLFGMAAVLGSLMSTVAAKTYTTSVPLMNIGADDFNADGVARTPNQIKISDDVNASIENAFESFNQGTLQLPLLAIIIVMTVVLSAVAGFFVFLQGGGLGKVGGYGTV